MTDFISDIARWQRDLPLSQLVKAGFGAVNIKTSEGLTCGAALYPDQADDVARAREARAEKLRLCTFHWLNNTASGAAQAQLAFSRIKLMGGPAGMAHSVDCEDNKGKPATWQIWADYVTTMTKLMGRPIFSYTGDWWWADHFAKKVGSTFTPYLWAAPADGGYPGSYPGDDAPQWAWPKSVGGWTELSAMQYSDDKPPYGTGVTTTVKISKTAIRDRAVWKAVAGVAW